MTEMISINGREFRVISSTPAKPVAAKRKAHRMIPRPLDGQPVSSGTLTLSVRPPSVNTLFHNRAKGRGKTLVYRNWRSIADRELRDQPSWHVPGKVKILVRVGGSRADSDNLLKATLDSLVTAGRIENDSPKYVIESRAIHDDTITGTRIEITAVPVAQARAA